MLLQSSSKPYSGFLVDKQDLRRWQWEERDTPSPSRLELGQILLEVTKFAFTANNVTYARLGDQFPYWRFFPAPGNWGYIPVWGLANVIHSRSQQVNEGECVYGYFPMATHLVLQPGMLHGPRFVDAAEHRQGLPPTYNEYVLVNRDPRYDHRQEHEHLVLRPLFSLSYFSSQWLLEERYFGASQILISSASSKTALGLAYLLQRARPNGMQIVALTSPANANFVRERGIYDRVVTYDAISTLGREPSAFVDIAGDAKVRAAVHHTLGDSLKHSARAGFTHWDALGSDGEPLPGPAPKIFFTPDHILRLRKEWGPETLAARLAEAWQGFLAFVAPWLRIEVAEGKGEVERIYLETVEGKTPPYRAHVLSITR